MKCALVTGATKGIGLGVAQMLLSEGYFVFVTYSSDEKSADNARTLLGSLSSHFEVLKADQDDYLEMARLVEHIRESGRRIHCLICNAGMTLRKRLEDMTNDEWNKVMNVNVNSNVFLIRDLKSLIPLDSRIVMIGSMMAVYPHGTSLAYGVTKSAVHALAKNLVKEFEGTGTTVNAIAPGFVETEWQKDKPIEIRNNIYAKSAVKRFATVEEIADAVRFCVKNPFVNGSIIEVSGGYCFK